MSRDICLRCRDTSQSGEGGIRTHDTTIFSRRLHQGQKPRPKGPEIASQCGIRGYLDWASYTRQGDADARKYREFQVGLGDEIGCRRPDDFSDGEGRNRTEPVDKRV